MTEELKTKTALLLLAGGRSSRMGGVNKALLPFNGGTLSGAVLARLGRDFASLWVSANRDAEAFEREGFRTLPDVREGFPGPLGGIEALGVRLDAEASAVEWVMVAPCDTPFLPEDLFERLSAAAAADRAAGRAKPAYVAHAAGRLQSTAALLSREALRSAGAFLVAGERKLGLWYERMGAGVVRFEDAAPEAFENINTPEDLRKWSE